MTTQTPDLEAPAAVEDPFLFGGKPFGSRLIVGTGKYKTFLEMRSALEASAAEIVTVAVRRVNLTDRTKESLLDYIPRGMTLLPNTAGCYSAEDAVRAARLGREVGLSEWVKLEVLGDEQTLWPDNEELLQATRTLVADGFVVFPYTSDDPIMARKLEDAGAVERLRIPVEAVLLDSRTASRVRTDRQGKRAGLLPRSLANTRAAGQPASARRQARYQHAGTASSDRTTILQAESTCRRRDTGNRCCATKCTTGRSTAVTARHCASSFRRSSATSRPSTS